MQQVAKSGKTPVYKLFTVIAHALEDGKHVAFKRPFREDIHLRPIEGAPGGDMVEG